MIVYVDLLILSNLLLDWSLIVFTGHIAKEDIRFWRIGLGAIIAVSSLILFFLPHSLLFVMGRFLFSVIIIVVAFPYRAFKQFIINLSIFYSLSFLVGGILISFNLSSSAIRVDFFDYKIWIILAVSFLFANSLTYIFKVQLVHHKLFIPVKIVVGEKVMNLIGFYDTGNGAVSSSGIPLVFVQAVRLGPLENLIRDGDIRMESVTWHTLGGMHKGLAFKPQAFYIKEGKRYRACEVLLTLVQEPFSDQGYQVLLNKKMFE